MSGRSRACPGGDSTGTTPASQGNNGDRALIQANIGTPVDALSTGGDASDGHTGQGNEGNSALIQLNADAPVKAVTPTGDDSAAATQRNDGDAALFQVNADASVSTLSDGGSAAEASQGTRRCCPSGAH